MGCNIKEYIMDIVNVGVVIPFYQKENGLLFNALNSIFKQKVVGVKFIITIVDDGSPIKALSEVNELILPQNCTLKVIEQHNQGPAAARNRALDYLSEQNISVVSFLDSDDCWLDFHIETAIKALCADNADFYFSDHSRFDSEHSLFKEVGCFNDFDRACKEYNIHKEKELAILSGEDCFSLFLKYYISQTSSVVYKFDNLKDHRFDESLLSAGEDYFLWLQLVNSSNKVVFSFKKGVYCGRGVNIFFDSFDWSKKEAASRIGYEALFYRKIYTHFNLNCNQKKIVKSNVSRLEEQYSYLLVKHVITGKGLNKGLLIKIFRTSPATLILLPLRLFNFILK